MRLRISLQSVGLLLAGAALLSAADWPQFRGPDSQGIAEQKDLPEEWGPDKNVAWKVDLPGVAWSQPIVWGTRSSSRRRLPRISRSPAQVLAGLAVQVVDGAALVHRVAASVRRMVGHGASRLRITPEKTTRARTGRVTARPLTRRRRKTRLRLAKEIGPAVVSDKAGRAAAALDPEDLAVVAADVEVLGEVSPLTPSINGRFFAWIPNPAM